MRHIFCEEPDYTRVSPKNSGDVPKYLRITTHITSCILFSESSDRATP